MTPDVAKRVIEGALLCANRPLAINDLRQLFGEEAEFSPDTVKSLLDELCLDWQGRSVELVSVASGWRFQCAADVAGHVLKLQPERLPRYSRAVMETLAIIAYHQPVTRGDIEEIRGVGVSAHIIKTLEDRGWIDQVGVKEVAGRPALFATTRQFLDDLNLRSLKDLPALDDAAVSPDLLAFASQTLASPVASVAIGPGDGAGDSGQAVEFEPIEVDEVEAGAAVAVESSAADRAMNEVAEAAADGVAGGAADEVAGAAMDAAVDTAADAVEENGASEAVDSAAATEIAAAVEAVADAEDGSAVDWPQQATVAATDEGEAGITGRATDHEGSAGPIVVEGDRQ